jgi:DNA-binding CsgD family transcriptional regulator
MAGLVKLTPDERQVAQAILRGESPKQTCSRLDIPRSRYKTHIQHLLHKTGSRGQVELVIKLRDSIVRF